MTLENIYSEFTVGSRGFVQAVQSHCGFCRSDAEIERIAERAATAAAFQKIWENESWWTDENNAG